MAQWGNTDDAANSAIWAVGGLNKTVNTANRDALFGNTTADAFVTGATVGQFGVDVAEAQAARATVGAPRSASAGWVLRTEGSGGRAGRVQMETLVAMRSITGDAEDVVFPDLTLLIGTQPQDTSVTSPADAVFTVSVSTVPAGGSVNYQWEVSTDGGSVWASTVDAVGTGATLTVISTDAEYVNDNQFRVVVSATGADSVTSAAAVLTVA